LFCLGLLSASAASISAQGLFVKPVKVLGDPNFIGTSNNPTAVNSAGPNVVEGRELQIPESIAIDNSASPVYLYVADTANNRILGFKYSSQQTPGAIADLILGQKDRFTTIPGGSGGGASTSLRSPSGLVVDSSGNLYVADTGNNRVLRYPKPFSSTATGFPDLIIGQSSFSVTTANTAGIGPKTLSLGSGRNGLAIDAAGNLWVADTANNRVLRFPASTLTQSNPAADLAVGQPDLISSTAATTRTTKLALDLPTGIAFDSASRLFVADHLGRVLVYAAGIGANASASRILGFNPTNGANSADAITLGGSSGSVEGVAVIGSSVFVTDTPNHRIVVFGAADSWPAESTQFSPTSIQIIGQTSSTGNTANGGKAEPSATTLQQPFDVTGNLTELYVADTGNNRVLVYPIGAAGISSTASRVIGQLDFPYRAPNLVEGKEFDTVSTGTILAGTAILDQSSTPPHLYVADTANNRILGFNDFSHATTGQTADIVIGQPDFFRTVINYPSGLGTQPNAGGLNGPTGLAIDSAGNLYVADTLNSRVLRFPAPFSSGVKAQERADLVIGQSDFTSAPVTDATQRTFGNPIGIAFTTAGADTSVANSGYLVVSDTPNNRVLLFPKPLSSGMQASIVLGQANFTSSASSSLASGLNSPEGVAVDPLDRILVADTANARIQVYPPVASLASSSAPPSFALTAGLAQPVSIGMAATGQFWVADPSSSAHLLHFPSIDQLPVSNPAYASDATLLAISPRSAFVDNFNNLLIADGANRILYYVPQVNVVNAANYLPGRALAAGAIASAFPTVSTTAIANGTAGSSTLPLPTVLADTQITVNGTPASLFYVSPTQINFGLSLNLPEGGTADLAVMRQSTGQIYAAAELPLASASPGLFVQGAAQSGPLAAIDVADSAGVNNTGTNTATNPVIRGQYITLFGTGQGLVTNPPPDFQAASGLAPSIVTPVVILGSGSNSVLVPAANIQYSGLAPGFVDLWQINVQIPPNAPTGTVPVSVLMNSISSGNTNVSSQVVTTIAIK
jgi:uncharacterized protein (TIGR03437 family)